MQNTLFDVNVADFIPIIEPYQKVMDGIKRID